MRSDRKHGRFIRRLETEFSADNKNYRGLSSDLSIRGLFIRTKHAFVPGTPIDIVIQLPGAADVKLKGIVRRTFNTPVKNGMGIEIIENDPRYIDFIRSVFPDAGEEPVSEGAKTDSSFQKNIQEPLPDEPLQTEFTIIVCPQCGARNKVNNAKLSLGPKCGKCGHPLISRT